MILAIGTKIKLKYTGDAGVVTELLGDGMVQVLLADGDEIPVALEDLIRPEDQRAGKGKSEVKAKIVTIPKPATPQKPDLPEAEQQYSILKSIGIQLGFLPINTADDSIDHYEIYLINDTRYSILFTFQLHPGRQGTQRPKINDKLEANSYLLLGELPFVALNDLPEVEMEAWQITTAGTGKRLYKKFKIRPKQFFGHVITAPLINKPVHHYRVFESFDPVEKKEEDLKSYTKRQVRPPQKVDGDLRHFSSNEIADFANFSSEIDLHIENLTNKSVKGMGNAEILRIQMAAFEKYLNKAIDLGVDRVFAIHGLGKGKLRNEIATRLMKNPDVVTFKNEFHPRYGYGATEVVLK